MKKIILIILIFIGLIVSACGRKNVYDRNSYERANSASQKAHERLDRE